MQQPYGIVGGTDNGDGTVSKVGTYGTLTLSTTSGLAVVDTTPGAGIGSLVITGTLTTSRKRRVAQLKAARGTKVATVGMRASCQPMPVLSSETPAACKASANALTSSQLQPCSTKSSKEMRKMMQQMGGGRNDTSSLIRRLR